MNIVIETTVAYHAAAGAWYWGFAPVWCWLVGVLVVFVGAVARGGGE